MHERDLQARELCVASLKKKWIVTEASTVPADYDELLSYYTHKGYRVIGCATKHIKKLSWVKAQKMKRNEVEADLDFVGFIIFENKLKPTTAAVLRELVESNIKAVMVTGDNILTAICVARECGMIPKSAHCFVPHFVEGNEPRHPRLTLDHTDQMFEQVTPEIQTPGCGGKASITMHISWMKILYWYAMEAERSKGFSY
jgi:cation-transporting ATPase 13A3/4/5